MALAEAEIHKRFFHPNILPLIDSSTLLSTQGEYVNLLFPFYRKGSLRNEINRLVIEGNGWNEIQIFEMFLGLCEGVSVFHFAEPPLVHRDIKVPF